MDTAVRLALDAGADPTRPSVIFADSGDNPGGGGGGNTIDLLKALHEARASGVIVGLFIDAELAAEAHRLGEGARFQAVFNRAGEGPYAQRFVLEATVAKLHDGNCVGRRGLYAGRSVPLGPTARLDIEGISVVVATERRQCADPVFFEMMGLDVGRARTVVVKSRGHFRAGFDEFFPPERVYEVDTPGVTSPVLERIAFKRLPRPVFPLDPETVWQRPAWA
jgi:microcystin degradation protein MlrC